MSEKEGSIIIIKTESTTDEEEEGLKKLLTQQLEHKQNETQPKKSFVSVIKGNHAV